MKSKNYLMIGSLVLISLILFIIGSASLVIAQDDEANYTAEVETDVLDAFDGAEWVSVIVEIYSENATIIDQILLNLTENEFKLKEKLLGNEGFAGEITKDGLEKLINNPDVRIIYLDRVAQILKNETGDKEEKDLEEINVEKINLWLIVIPILIFLLIILYLINLNKK